LFDPTQPNPIQPDPKPNPNPKPNPQRPWQHSECWWPRLFVDGGDGAGAGGVSIAWDDADKDYTDLPPEVR